MNKPIPLQSPWWAVFCGWALALGDLLRRMWSGARDWMKEPSV